MSEPSARVLFWLVPVLAVLGETARAQCTAEWRPGFQVAGAGGLVRDLAVFDDGQGPALFACGGSFDYDGVRHQVVISRRGGVWDDRGDGFDFGTGGYALEVLDLGTGPALYLGGWFTGGVRRWTPGGWVGLGGGVTHPTFQTRSVHALCGFDDGTGPVLVAGGTFTQAGGVPAANVALWDGSAWAAMGAGLGGSATTQHVDVLCVYDDGTGPRVYAGGNFTSSGASAVPYLARWSGSAWEPVPGGPLGPVEALAVFDDGTGARLHVGGSFPGAGAIASPNVVRWDGAQWSGLAGGTSGPVTMLHVDVDTHGPRLYVGGEFLLAGSVSANGIAEWTPTGFQPLGIGVVEPGSSTAPRVLAGARFDDGDGARLHFGGTFRSAGNLQTTNIAAWDGASWSRVGTGLGVDGTVQSLLAADLGDGPSLYVGGTFRYVGSVRSPGVARWDGNAWHALTSGFDPPSGGTSVGALAVADLGAGPALYAAGTFTRIDGVDVQNIACWDGNGWSPLGAGLSGTVLALAEYDDGTGPQLYAGGRFTGSGATALAYVARWDGVQWSHVGGGVTQTSWPSPVRCLQVFDSGSGPRLVIGGTFEAVGGVPASNVAAWDGSTWSALGTGLILGFNEYPPEVRSFVVHDFGSGARLCAGGSFTFAGAVQTGGGAQFDGAAWTPLPGGPSGELSELLSFRDWYGPILVTYGSGNRGGGWFPYPGGMPPATLLERFDDGHGGGDWLYVGGSFSSASAASARSLAAWHGCALNGAAFCAGDGADPTVTTPCPCGNTGASGRGCASSVVPEGALLSVLGATLADDVVLRGSGMPATSPCIYLKGDGALYEGTPFGDGVRCVDGALIRLATVFNSGGASQYPSGSQAALSVRGQTPPGSSLTAYYQVYYRSATASFCPPAVFNVSNGWQLVW